MILHFKQRSSKHDLYRDQHHGLEEIKARVRELADLTERMHVALGKLENCKINIEAGIDGLSPMESSQVKSNNQT